jgi:hypothetical protein
VIRNNTKNIKRKREGERFVRKSQVQYRSLMSGSTQTITPVQHMQTMLGDETQHMGTLGVHFGITPRSVTSVEVTQNDACPRVIKDSFQST